MRKCFVPSYYYRDQHQKLQRLYQGTKSFEDYHKEMEMTMIKANLVEDRETTMTRFLNGLNRKIADIVELQHYVELEDMVNMAMKVERWFKMRTTIRAAIVSINTWSSKWSKQDGKPRTKPSFDVKDLAKVKMGMAGWGFGEEILGNKEKQDSKDKYPTRPPSNNVEDNLDNGIEFFY
ncbi:hypothetical protein Cni_G16083 [Canna indica]|uniref:Retrotransposon gag domain-containing protein n=1 Tax=Canna indica TaxID=4628 RepID=A0AAQ3KI33_9LILI|nr:hypothetical protein Cni_G16083 [Canna indica]